MPSGIAARVIARLVITLAIFNPTGYSVGHWLWNGNLQTGAGAIVAIVTAMVAMYLIYLMLEFASVTLIAGIAFAGMLGAAAGSGWIDLTSARVWGWGVPIYIGLIQSAGPVFNIVRRRDAKVYGTDENPET